MKILFFGTPEFSVPFLKALVDDKRFEVVGVVCQPDKPSGRGNRVVACPVKQFAETIKVHIYQPSSLKVAEAAQTLLSIDADAFVVVAYGKLIPPTLLHAPRLGCINVHPSLLPAYRGPSPMQWAIAQGDTQTGVSIMLLDEGMDTGPILAQETIGIDDNETYDSLVRKVHTIGPRLLLETLDRLGRGEVIPAAQDETQSSLTRLLEKEDGRINWHQSMVDIERKARAYHPWPGAWSVWNRAGKELRLKILFMKPADFRADVPPGTVTVKNNRLFVDAADGTMELCSIQPEGKAAMDAVAFLNGYSDVNGATLA